MIFKHCVKKYKPDFQWSNLRQFLHTFGQTYQRISNQGGGGGRPLIHSRARNLGARASSLTIHLYSKATSAGEERSAAAADFEYCQKMGIITPAASRSSRGWYFCRCCLNYQIAWPTEITLDVLGQQKGFSCTTDVPHSFLKNWREAKLQNCRAALYSLKRKCSKSESILGRP